MTNDELKKKILSIVRGAMLEADELPFIETTEYVADALIAAGIGDVKEVEHRAEKVERALKDCIDYYSYSGLCPVLDCNYNKACWRKQCTPDIEKCFMIQAEKELAEERK